MNRYPEAVRRYAWEVLSDDMERIMDSVEREWESAPGV
jgi:hypothetical protein